MTPEDAKALRQPFPAEVVGKLPKGGVMLDYVGHAAVVDRLLAVDPGWFWEPFAVDALGLPAVDERGNLWIRLHILDTVTIGVGDGPDAKQRISDALRNAAMRRGVALDLWAKEDLQVMHQPPPEPVEPEQVASLVERYTTTTTLGEIGMLDRTVRALWPRLNADQRAQVTEARAGAVA